MYFRTIGRTAFLVCVMLTTSVALSGCETVEKTMAATKDKISSIDFSLPSFRTKDDATMMAAENNHDDSANSDCPQVDVIPELRSIHQFLEGGSTRAADEVAAITMTGFKTACKHNANNVVIDLDVRFEATLGPKAQAWSDTRPGFAWPWFVAISTPNGNIMAKEVFAVTISFDEGQTHVIHEEHLRQIIPTQGEYGMTHELLMGFQLTDADLAYNRALMGTQNKEAITETALGENNPALVFEGDPALANESPMPVVKPPKKKPDAPDLTKAPVIQAPVKQEPVVAEPIVPPEAEKTIEAEIEAVETTATAPEETPSAVEATTEPAIAEPTAPPAEETDAAIPSFLEVTPVDDPIMPEEITAEDIASEEPEAGTETQENFPEAQPLPNTTIDTIDDIDDDPMKNW